MGQARLTGLPLLNVCLNHNINIEEVVNKFTRLPRKWDFIH